MFVVQMGRPRLTKDLKLRCTFEAGRPCLEKTHVGVEFPSGTFREWWNNAEKIGVVPTRGRYATNREARDVLLLVSAREADVGVSETMILALD